MTEFVSASSFAGLFRREDCTAEATIVVRRPWDSTVFVSHSSVETLRCLASLRNECAEAWPGLVSKESLRTGEMRGRPCSSILCSSPNNRLLLGRSFGHHGGVEPLSAEEIQRAVAAALAEDIGSGDVTTLAAVPESGASQSGGAGARATGGGGPGPGRNRLSRAFLNRASYPRSRGRPARDRRKASTGDCRPGARRY